MRPRPISSLAVGSASALVVAAVWLVHGLYNKLLGGSPRHLAIVQATPGLDGAAGEQALAAIGMLEVAIAVWVLSAWAPRLCAAAQTIALLSMNGVELTFARDLLLWPAALIPLNLLFLTLAWVAAAAYEPRTLRARLRRQPLPVEAHFRDCLTLTYAVPGDVLRPLVPPGLELETIDGNGFVAVALVQTESLRPAGVPRMLGQDFFLAGYRVFTRCRAPDGRALRGLRILRSDANRTFMVAAGNLLTHYNYHRCIATIASSSLDARLSVVVRTADGNGDLEVVANLGDSALPSGSPFATLCEARRFAGPLPFTFDYEPETQAILVIRATRTNWKPAPVRIETHRIAWFDQPVFRGCTPVLAGAFHVKDVEYRWERGTHHPLRP